MTGCKGVFLQAGETQEHKKKKQKLGKRQARACSCERIYTFAATRASRNLRFTSSSRTIKSFLLYFFFILYNRIMADVSPVAAPSSRKRKLSEDPIEIDLGAPEPPSKKALRKAKKKSNSTPVEKSTSATSETEAEPAAGQRTKQRSSYGIWIGNLPFTASKEDLQKFFVEQGSFQPDEITRVNLPGGDSKQNRGRQNKGFAYVDFTTNEAVKRAIALSEKLVAGRRVLIKDANNFEGRPDKSQQADSASAKPGNPPSRKIFVGNLGFDVTKESLEQHFKPCGEVSSVHVASFEDSGKCKGYGWVEFGEIEAAEAAVRGFVKIVEQDSDSESSDENSDEESSTAEDKKKSAKKEKKKKKEKKVWVNRLMGRPLRMEFAEDQTTRYKKRFSKEGTTNTARGENNDTDMADTENNSARDRQPRRERPAQGKPKKDAQSYSRYSDQTVQRLSGAIVESQGKKVTFD